MRIKALVGVIVWAIDPVGNNRYLIRHNKPFDGYPDEWNFVYGHIETDESEIATAKRELAEEFGLDVKENALRRLEYSISKDFATHTTQIIYYSTKLDYINTDITLNEESIGFDWVLESELKIKLLHREQFNAIKHI